MVILALGPETLLRSPGLNKGAINAEVFITDQVFFASKSNDFLKQYRNNFMLQLPIPIFVDPKPYHPQSDQ